MKRRTFLRGAIAIAGAACVGGCERTVTREAVLRALVQEVVRPDAAAIAESSLALQGAIAQLDGSSARLEHARASFRSAALAWQRAYAVRLGPMADTLALQRATFWPIRRDALHQAMADASAADAAGVDARIEEIGVDAKGLFALEHLLFEDTESTATKRAFCAGLARDVVKRAEYAANALEHGHFAGDFARAGQASADLLVNQMLDTMETIAADRLRRALAMHDRDGASTAEALQRELLGGPSGLSVAIPLEQLRTLQRLYIGGRFGGLTALVQHVSPDVDNHLRKAFANAMEALAGVPEHLEQAVVHDRAAVERAIARIKELEVATRVELVQALGIHLTFVSTDGD